MRSKNAVKLLLLLAVTMISFSASDIFAGAKKINIQGRLTQADGVTALGGPVDLYVRLSTQPTGGSPVFGEKHNSVPLTDGVFNVILGNSPTLIEPNTAFDSINFDKQYYVSIQVNGQAEMADRQIISASGYSLGSLGDFNVNDKLYVGPKAGSNKLNVNGGMEITGTGFAGSGDGIMKYSAGGLGIANAGNTALYTKNSNVGIGTIEPAAPLHLVKTSAGLVANLLRLSNDQITSGTGVGIEFTMAPARNYKFRVVGAATASNPSPLNPSLYFQADNAAGSYSDIMTLKYDGKIGIGTSNPQAKLSIYDAVSPSIRVYGNDDTVGANLELFNNNNSGNGWIIFSEANTKDLNFRNYTLGNGSTKVTVKNNTGNVGIGTTNPDTQLELWRSGGNSGLKVTASGGGHAKIDLAIEDIAVGNTWTIFAANPQGTYTALNGGLVIANSTLDSMSINKSGNVGIGNVNPDAKLDVGTGGSKPEALTGCIVICRGRMWADEAFKPSGGGWSSYSDKRLKKNITTLSNSLGKMLKLHGVNFEWDATKISSAPTGVQMGMVAQEIEEVIPEWVKADENGIKYVTITGFEALTAESIKALQSEIDLLKNEINDLKSKIK